MLSCLLCCIPLLSCDLVMCFLASCVKFLYVLLSDWLIIFSSVRCVLLVIGLYGCFLFICEMMFEPFMVVIGHVHLAFSGVFGLHIINRKIAVSYFWPLSQGILPVEVEDAVHLSNLTAEA